jgi:hypothetical protein
MKGFENELAVRVTRCSFAQIAQSTQNVLPNRYFVPKTISKNKCIYLIFNSPKLKNGPSGENYLNPVALFGHLFSSLLWTSRISLLMSFSHAWHADCMEDGQKT